MNTRVKVYLYTSHIDTQVNFWYDPPRSLWRFHERTDEELMQELSIICQKFVYGVSNETTRETVRVCVENHINHWLNSGWISIDHLYEVVKQAENNGDI